MLLVFPEAVQGNPLYVCSLYDGQRLDVFLLVNSTYED